MIRILQEHRELQSTPAGAANVAKRMAGHSAPVRPPAHRALRRSHKDSLPGLFFHPGGVAGPP